METSPHCSTSYDTQTDRRFQQTKHSRCHDVETSDLSSLLGPVPAHRSDCFVRTSECLGGWRLQSWVLGKARYGRSVSPTQKAASGTLTAVTLLLSIWVHYCSRCKDCSRYSTRHLQLRIVFLCQTRFVLNHDRWMFARKKGHEAEGVPS